ncbi:MAG TPA: VCBS repeat-containing protein [Pyrinomonadaceae bacterium]|nr:VCBS repeat-containing protein [Pyrinomonadaceae bacterium]
MSKLFPALCLCVSLILTSSCQAQTRQNAAQNSLFTIAPGFPLNLGSRPSDLAVGDLNKDGRIDVVTCNDDDTVKVLLNDGRGSFVPAPGSPIKAAAHLIDLGDVNNDRNLDIALTHHDSLGVQIFLGAGNGRFSAAPGSPFIAHPGDKAHNHGLTLSDLNSDRNLDITTSNQDDNSVSVLLGNGRGSFAPAAGSPFAVGRAPYPHAVGDVNKDGNLDIVAPNVGGNSVSVLVGNGRGEFRNAPNSPISVAGRPFYAAIGDVNGDSHADLMTTHDDINLMTTLLGDGRGGFTPARGSPFDLGRRGYAILAADLMGDARTEVIVNLIGRDSLIVLLSTESGGYTLAAGSPYQAGLNPKLATADFNGDGKLDIITAGNESSDLTVLLQK